jgi:hypothetical protein
MPATVLPVSAAAALDWARGKINDRDLILSAPLVPEAIFVVDLPDRASWRDCLAQCTRWHAAGAVTLITRTGTPVVAHYMQQRGCRVTHLERTNPRKWRFILPPADLAAWIKSLPGRHVTPGAGGLPKTVSQCPE